MKPFSSSSDYLDQMRERAAELTNQMISDAGSQAETAKEQLKLLEQQILYLERKQKLEADIAKTTAEQIKEQTIFEREREAHRFAQRQYETDPNIDIRTRNEMMRNASYNIRKQETERYRDSIRTIDAQFKEDQLQTALQREMLNAIKQSSFDQKTRMFEGETDLVDAIDYINEDKSNAQEALANSLASEEYNKRKEQEDSERVQQKEASVQESFKNFAFWMQGLSSTINTARGIAGSASGFDALEKVSNATESLIIGASSLIGTAIGALVMKSPGGAAGGGAAGAAAGNVIAGAFGVLSDTEISRLKIREQVDRERSRLNALTGGENDAFQMEQYGYSYLNTIQAQQQVAQGYMSSRDLIGRTQDFMAYQKGYGLDSGILTQLMELQRTTNDSNRDIGKVIEGALRIGDGGIFKDGDRTALPVFLNAMMTLQRTLLQGSEEVKDSTAASIIANFDKIGGQFSFADPRSQGNIMGIQQGLTNPSSDGTKAMSFLALRKLYPDADIFSILEKQQGGLDTPGYLQGMIEYVKQIGGDKSHQMMNLSGLLPNLSRAAIRRLFEASEQGVDFTSFKQESFPTGLNEKVFEEAGRNTTQWEQFEATMSNRTYDETIDKRLKELVDQIGTAIKTALSNTKVDIQVIQTEKGYIVRKPVVQVNRTQSVMSMVQQAKEEKERQSEAIRDGIISGRGIGL